MSDEQEDVYHVYVMTANGEKRYYVLGDVSADTVDRWIENEGPPNGYIAFVRNSQGDAECSLDEWKDMREHLRIKEKADRMKGPFSIFIQHGDLVEYMIEDATGEVVAAWADQNKNADHLKVFVRDEGTRKRYDVDDWVKTWNLRKMFEKADEEPEQQNTDDTQDPLEFLAELGAIADRNMSVQRIVMEAMTDTVKNLTDDNKTDRAKAIGLGQIVQFTTQQIIELFD